MSEIKVKFTSECSYCYPTQFLGSKKNFLIISILEVSFLKTDKKQQLIRISQRMGSPFDSCSGTCESWTKLDLTDSLFQGLTPCHIRIILLPLYIPHSDFYKIFLDNFRNFIRPQWFFEATKRHAPFYSYSGKTLLHLRNYYIVIMNEIRMTHKVILYEEKSMTLKCLAQMEYWSQNGL